MYTEAPGLVRSSADDRAIAQPSNDYGLAAQLRVIALFDGSVKGVHIDVDDFRTIFWQQYYSGFQNGVNTYRAVR